MNAGTLTSTAPLSLQTPLEIIGFDARAVSRIWPHADATDAETNFFPLIEFQEADLPWRYTPQAADANDRLTPWLCLIVLNMETGTGLPEGTYTPPSGAAGLALGRLSVNANVPLPLLSQAWAWAHVQLSGADPAGGPISATTISAALGSAPHTVVARLVCPRRLDPSVHYTAFLVPTFRQGVDTGLGISSAAAVQDLAWSGATSGAGLTLPVYYQWSFRTGQGGDFESLVRLLKPEVLPDSVGRRDMDVSSPGAGLPPTPPGSATPLALEGALKGPTTVSTLWPDSEKSVFVSAMAGLINSPADVVAPPVYGRWPARWTPTVATTALPDTPPPWWRSHGRWPAKRRLASTLPNATDPPTWLQRLNQDPRTRVAAGLGTRVVQDEQRQLMASAWQQVGAIRDINSLLRKAQLARELSAKLHARYLAPLSADAVLFLTRPVQGRVLQSSQTVLDLVRHSPPRRALLSGAWRRLARPLGSLGRRQGKPDQPAMTTITNVNAGTWKADPGPPAPTNLPTHGWINSLSKRRGPKRFVPDKSLPWKTYVAWLGTPSPSAITNGTKLPTTFAWDSIYDPKQGSSTEGQTQPPISDSASMGRFRTAAASFASRTKTPAAGETLHQLAISTLVTTMTSALDPHSTIPVAITSRVGKAAGFTYSPADSIEPVMAYPDFPQPMYEPLAAISQDWILPGLSDVPAQSVTLAVTNQAFIEAYMVGLSHEMARELLWNEYPTDQRGTYFRQFWDPAGFVPADESPISDSVRESLRDITPIHTWQTVSDLGSHKPGGVADVVLLVRGEVFRRYPGTIVYAVKAVLDGYGHAALPPDESTNPAVHLFPAFRGALPADIAFFGFNLSEEAAKGDGTIGREGYFFCFQEQAGEPRFGLDADGSGDPVTWDDLSWPQLDGPSRRPKWMKGGFRVKRTQPMIGYIDLDGSFPDTSFIPSDPLTDPAKWHASSGLGHAGARGADLAYITYRKPVRILIHASEMLP